MDKRSFSSLEHEFMHKLRNCINHSEDIIDLENHFSYTASDLLKRVFDDTDLKITSNDIAFVPKGTIHYRVNEDLFKSKSFIAVWKDSDLKNIISRFADCTYKRYQHMDRNQVKSEIKIRN